MPPYETKVSVTPLSASAFTVPACGGPLPRSTAAAGPAGEQAAEISAVMNSDAAVSGRCRRGENAATGHSLYCGRADDPEKFGTFGALVVHGVWHRCPVFGAVPGLEVVHRPVELEHDAAGDDQQDFLRIVVHIGVSRAPARREL